jgi:glycosyltransferase involved in cell wall biosynthesis
MKTGGFVGVNTHSPVANAVGRFSAWIAGIQPCFCTVHGFYFHQNSNPLIRFFLVSLERLLGGVTDFFLFVSDEDRRTALAAGIARNAACTLTFFNGVDVDRMVPRDRDPDGAVRLKRKLDIPEGHQVVGIVARIVREKGHREFLSMANAVISSGRTQTTFLVVGDSFPSDRDQFGKTFRLAVKQQGCDRYFRFTGLVSDVPPLLRIMDLFVLPTYREGFPKSVLEAMSCALPVITTNVRGCREAVIHGTTGILVPPRDTKALVEAVTTLLDNAEAARQMGTAGRERALMLYRQSTVTETFLTPFRALRARC